jgi:NADP-dependent aldehyde dehydrogenase
VTDIDTDPSQTSLLEVSDVVERAVAAAPTWREIDPVARAGILHAVADRLDPAADELVSLAMRETHLGEARLRGELARTTFQLRFLAGVIEEGDQLQACIDTADASWPPGARPDLRRWLRPIGPVAVFAASNFPFRRRLRISPRCRLPCCREGSPWPPSALSLLCRALGPRPR